MRWLALASSVCLGPIVVIYIRLDGIKRTSIRARLFKKKFFFFPFLSLSLSLVGQDEQPAKIWGQGVTVHLPRTAHRLEEVRARIQRECRADGRRAGLCCRNG